jgi:hypothetical protein
MSANESPRWKAVFAALNPSPVFDAVAMFAEGLAMRDDESRSKETTGATDLRWRSEIGKGACSPGKMRRCRRRKFERTEC